MFGCNSISILHFTFEDKTLLVTKLLLKFYKNCQINENMSQLLCITKVYVAIDHFNLNVDTS